LTDKAVILANYTHAEFKPGLKVCRIVLEIPQEKRKEFFDAFGYPDPANPIPVALARLADGSAPSAPERAAEGPTASIPQVPQEGLRDKAESRAQAAGRLCKRSDFQEWVAKRSGASDVSEEAAARYVRATCMVMSRSNLDHPGMPGSHERWDRLRDTYEVETKWGRS
jgi:hypothetical protein